jgi:glycosyltransferase involved in cell wall biosynthesis
MARVYAVGLHGVRTRGGLARESGIVSAVNPKRVLAVLPAFIPSTLISVVKPFVRLHHAGRIRARVTLEHFTRPSDVEWAEVVVFCRNLEPPFAWVREALLARGTPYVYDLDDNLFEVPEETPEGRYHRDPSRLAELERYVRLAALVRVYSESLRERVAVLNPRLEQVLPSLDWSLIPDEPPARDPRRVRIVYVTSRLRDDLARVFIPDLEGMLERFSSRVELAFWGAAGAARGLRGVRRIAPVPDYDRFLGRLARSGFDIGLAPLIDDEFHRSKTNNKYREYGACRIAGVYSDVSVYSSCVRHGETGLLVDKRPGAWFEAVARLVEDADLRTRIQVLARSDVRSRHSQEETEAVWLEQLDKVWADRMMPRAPISPPAVGRAALPSGLRLHERLRRLGRRLVRTGPRATLAGVVWYVHGLRTMRRLHRELSGQDAPDGE